MRTVTKILSVVTLAASLALSAFNADAAPEKDFKAVWSIYVRWMRPGHATDHGSKLDVAQFKGRALTISEEVARLAAQPF